MEPWELQNENPQKWQAVRLAKNREERRAALADLDLAQRLEPLFSAAISDHNELLAIEKSAEGQQQIVDETLRKIKLLDSFPPKSITEAEKAATQRVELEQVLVTATRIIRAAEAAKNPRRGLELYFAEMYGIEKLPEHSGPLSSWLPSAGVAAAAAKMNVSLWRVGDWRKIKPECDDADDASPHRYRSF